MNPKISVIMNCLNCEKYLKEAIDSIYAQTFTDWEIIFWDNDSSDGSKDIAKSYDHKLKYFKSDSTLHLGEARNLAVEKASGEYLAFLDCDDIALPHRLEEQINFMENNPQYGLVGAQVDIINEKSEVYDNLNFPTDHKTLFTYILLTCPIIMPTAFVRKINFIKVKGFNAVHTLAIDYDLWSKIAFNSKIANINKVLCRYRVHSENFTNRKWDVIVEETKKIFLWQLNKIGLFPTEDELNIHSIVHCGMANDKNYNLLQLKQWFNKILDNNRLNNIYQEDILKTTLVHFWNKAIYNDKLIINTKCSILFKILFSKFFNFSHLKFFKKTKLLIKIIIIKSLNIFYKK